MAEKEIVEESKVSLDMAQVNTWVGVYMVGALVFLWLVRKGFRGLVPK